MAFWTKLVGDPNARIRQQLEAFAAQVSAEESAVAALGDEALTHAVAELKQQVQSGTPLNSVQPKMFALVREAAKRQLQQRHYDVQVMGGDVLHQGKIAEMKTGEGKTLVATLAASLNALTGKGVHLVTVNDYLAKRDAHWMGAVYTALGLTVGVIQHEQAFLYDPTFTQGVDPLIHLKPVERREAYAADITYGTNNEFGFDYLRDNMAPERALKVQRPLHYAIVDEVDSILIDEARTPLIISAPAEDSTDLYYRYAQLVVRLEAGTDYNVDEKRRTTTLTEAGLNKMETLLGIKNIYDDGGVERAHHIEQALKAHALFKKDKDYVVQNGEVIIVDEFTGRMMPGRRYSEGLHQAIEAKEGVQIQQESQTLATITFQNYFRLYEKLSGMTGTAASEAEEFHKIYNLDVVEIPTHRPMARTDMPDAIFPSEVGKYKAVAAEIRRRHERGQPVLVGTISVEKNEILHELLEREGVPHEVLNAKNHERESTIIAQAGRRGAVTIATNMAGRGVDIILGGSPVNPAEQQAVREAGGLHVLGTERHESRRIDNQLRGRSGRQGDPGSSQFYLSLEDDLMRIFGSDRLKGLMQRMNVPEDMPIESRMVSRSIESAQKKVEGHNFDIRKHLVEYDDVMNKHREVIYRRRDAWLDYSAPQAKEQVLELVDGEIEQLVGIHTAGENDSQWNLEEIYESLDALFAVPIEQRIRLEDIRKQNADKADRPHIREALYQHLEKLSATALTSLQERLGGEESFALVSRAVFLRTLDQLWIEHLDLMTSLRESIGLRGYGQRDPLVEYKREAYRLFTELTQSINASFVNTIFKVSSAPTQTTPHRHTIESGPAKTMIASSNSSTTAAAPILNTNLSTTAAAANSLPKVGRNDPCPCGSGKKYKKCHGA